jgi:hypothetical protein
MATIFISIIITKGVADEKFYVFPDDFLSVFLFIRL